MLTGIEIFSGAGGLAKGLEDSGIRHRAFVEWNKNACGTLRKNFGESYANLTFSSMMVSTSLLVVRLVSLFLWVAKPLVLMIKGICFHTQ